MHLILIILGLLLLIILVPLLILSLVAYTKLRALWYKITGRQPSNNDPFFRFTTNYGQQDQQQTNRNSHQQSQQANSQHTSQSASPNQGKKIFSANEGEYVDFEMVD